jgi:hypothetical protein
MNLKGYGSKRSCYNSYYASICLEEPEKPQKNLRLDNQCPGKDSNQSPPEYKYSESPLDLLLRKLLAQVSEYQLSFKFHPIVTEVKHKDAQI